MTFYGITEFHDPGQSAIQSACRRALYNFLSTFSGTHYVTPRTFTGTIGFHF